MSEYEKVRASKLVLKGEKLKSKKRKHKKRKAEKEPKEDKDSINHGNWWKVSQIEDLNGPVAIEFGSHCYVKAMDNGLFTLGAPHSEGEGPHPEEIITAIPINERKIAFKSGYGKYLCVEKNGVVTGRSDAIGPMEHWEPVFQEGKMALQGFNDCFISVEDSDDSIIAKSKVAGDKEFLQVRCQTVRKLNVEKDVPEEEKGGVKQMEINYVKKFQKFQDKRLRISADGSKDLMKAKEEGTLHEKLLDRRSKMKADRYCK